MPTAVRDYLASLGAAGSGAIRRRR
jgi:hypothetical protein